MPSRNVTIRDNVLGTGMGMSVGSSVSGGVEDVLYEHNVMTEDATEWGQGTHLKTAAARGGFVRNVVWQHSVFNVVSSAGIQLETGYQSGPGGCDASNCTYQSAPTATGSSFYPRTESECFGVCCRSCHAAHRDG